jgi:hypothetical protein
VSPAVEAAERACRAAVVTLQHLSAGYGGAVRRCLALAAMKDTREQEAIARIRGSAEDPTLNPETNRPHSYSSAEKVKGTDEAYRNYLIELAGAEGHKEMLKGEVAAATVVANLQRDLLRHAIQSVDFEHMERVTSALVGEPRGL